jgi:hypothetical protein
MTIAVLACGPRLGPANADFSHQFEVKFEPAAEESRAPHSGEVKLLEADRLPEGIRRKTTLAGSSTVKRVPIPGSFEVATGYPTVDDPHLYLGVVHIAATIRYQAFKADDDEIAAEEAALAAEHLSLAKQAAQQHGGNAVIAGGTTMKGEGVWWRHPSQERLRTCDRKRCVDHRVSFKVFYVSTAAAVTPSPDALLKGLVGEGYREARRVKDPVDFVVPIKRHHCYSISFALEEGAKLPAHTHILDLLGLDNMYRRLSVDVLFRRGNGAEIGCASHGGPHDFKLGFYEDGRMMTRNRKPASEVSGLVWALGERRMKPDEVKQYFCGQCHKQARSCGNLVYEHCRPLLECLKHRGMAVAQCKDQY